MEMEQVICGRMYVDGELRYTEVGINEGKIVAVGRHVSGGEERVDLGTSVTVLPGFMDPHVHFRDPGLTHKEDFPTGTSAAVCGGVTCILDMPNTKPPVADVQTLLDKKRRVAGRAYADYGLFAAVTANCPVDLLAPHVPAFKLFMGSTTGNILLNDDEEIAPVMDEIARTGKVLSVHAEDDNHIVHGVQENCCQDHLRNRPVEAEYSALRRLAPYKDRVKVNICHCTNAEQVRQATELGFTTEVTMHHLCFDALRNTSAFYKTNPPIRDADTRADLFKAFVEGRITMFGTDHAPHTYDEKTQEFDAAPGGIPGVETCMPMVMDMVRTGDIPLSLAVTMGAENPCERFSVRKGRIAVGYDADLSLFDMRKVTQIDLGRLHTMAGFNPYSGRNAIFPDTVIIRGQVQVKDGELCGEPIGRDICG
ncbi:MAG: dihydroorotase family protein [archaeon]|nr:dihydroorotase family protein [archaeon]